MEEVKKKVNARQKGHNFERGLVTKFKNLGFSECSTSRFESKKMDDCGVDLMNIPIHVQAKAVEKLGSVHEIINRMPTDKPRAVFHKRNNKGIIVSMPEEFFFEMFKKYFNL